jgi:hypothetical protein
MSSVKITGNASGTGVFTITSPNSNTDRTLTLPDAAGDVVLANSSTSYLGIGTTSPSHPLHIVTSTDGTGVSGDDKFVALFQNAEATDGRSYGVKIMAGSTTDQALTITDHDGSNDLMSVDGAGRVVKPKNVSFRASGNNGNYITTTPIPFPDVTTSSYGNHNVGHHYNASTYTFTAPVAGRYYFFTQLQLTSSATTSDHSWGINLHFQVNGGGNHANGYQSLSTNQGGGSTYCFDDDSKYCSMHGVQEANQDIREECVLDKYGIGAWFDFATKMNAECTAQNADTCYENVATSLGYDLDYIKNCEATKANDYGASNAELMSLFGAQGSPAIYINGECAELGG